jgi:hypothetical protein
MRRATCSGLVSGDVTVSSQSGKAAAIRSR